MPYIPIRRKPCKPVHGDALMLSRHAGTGHDPRIASGLGDTRAARPRAKGWGRIPAACVSIWLTGLSTCAVYAAEPDAPPRVAVVVANTVYPGLPSLPRCGASAHAIADALRQGGFDVAEADDASNGEIGGLLGALKARLHPGLRPGSPHAAPQGAAVLYVCGYARGFDSRGYVLPVDAQIEQPTDLLAQGVLLRSFVNATAESGAAAGLVLLDLVPAAGDAELRPGLDALTSLPSPSIGIAAALAPAPSAGGTDAKPAATPLAIAAAAVLSAPQPEAGAVIAAIREKADPGDGRLVAVPPTAAARLDPAIPAPVVNTVATTDIAPANPSPSPPASEATATTGPTAPAAPPQATPPQAGPPPADISTDAGRRSVQQDLLRMGYYAGPVDGILGPDSQAAIRRLRHELGDNVTGSLTADEITQLQARAR